MKIIISIFLVIPVLIIIITLSNITYCHFVSTDKYKREIDDMLLNVASLLTIFWLFGVALVFIILLMIKTWVN